MILDRACPFNLLSASIYSRFLIHFISRSKITDIENEQEYSPLLELYPYSVYLSLYLRSVRYTLSSKRMIYTNRVGLYNKINLGENIQSSQKGRLENFICMC